MVGLWSLPQDDRLQLGFVAGVNGLFDKGRAWRGWPQQSLRASHWRWCKGVVRALPLSLLSP